MDGVKVANRFVTRCNTTLIVANDVLNDEVGVTERWAELTIEEFPMQSLVPLRSPGAEWADSGQIWAVENGQTGQNFIGSTHRCKLANLPTPAHSRSEICPFLPRLTQVGQICPDCTHSDATNHCPFLPISAHHCPPLPMQFLLLICPFRCPSYPSCPSRPSRQVPALHLSHHVGKELVDDTY